jgi:hypothetical protein
LRGCATSSYRSSPRAVSQYITGVAIRDSTVLLTSPQMMAMARAELALT